MEFWGGLTNISVMMAFVKSPRILGYWSNQAEGFCIKYCKPPLYAGILLWQPYELGLTTIGCSGIVWIISDRQAH